MEIIKAGLGCITFLFIMVGFTSPKSLSGKCDGCDAYLSQKDSITISREFKKPIDSFTVKNLKKVDQLNDSINKIETKINENRNQRSSPHTKGKR